MVSQCTSVYNNREILFHIGQKYRRPHLQWICAMSVFTEISQQGEKYLDRQIENAVNGVKEMKTVMQKSSEDHQKLLDALQKTKEQKEVPDCTVCQISAQSPSVINFFLIFHPFLNSSNMMQKCFVFFKDYCCWISSTSSIYFLCDIQQ